MKPVRLILFLFILSCSSTQDKEKQKILLFRTIGHHLLLSSGDSTSRVLPIQKTESNTYQIRFENNFEIIPDSLASITIKTLKKDPSKDQYLVSVYTCQNPDMVYGFEWSAKNPQDIACIGRKLPDNCYIIEIEIIDSDLIPFSLWWLSVIPFLAIIFYIVYKRKPKKTDQKTDDFQKLGAFNYFQKTRILVLEYQKIELSEKENKLLNILLSKPNETVARDYLLKEIWENEGVFVISRNLDVLVSKLRKKLVADSSIKITNIHSKGYKLEIQS